MSSHNLYISGQVYELIMSVRTGLPFVPHDYIRAKILSELAVQQSRYPVDILNFAQLPNHFHFALRVLCPTDFFRFVGHFKSEVSHAMNRMFGTTGTTFWCIKDDKPIILSPDKVEDRLVYHLLNPAKAGLVDSIEDYPLINTYKELLNDDGSGVASEQQWRRIPRTAFKKLPEGKLTEATKQRLTDEVMRYGDPNNPPWSKKEEDNKVYTLKITPSAWLESFSATRGRSKELWQGIKARVIARVKEGEKRYAEERRKQGKRARGADALRAQDPRQPYESKRNGKRSRCLSNCKEQRKEYIRWYQGQAYLARQQWKKWAAGDRDALPPEGFFYPGGALFAALIVCPVPT